ncbi:hypothetical protein K458DRAFT_492189 [Lentithecium fluviatile CBS 122367]|uniref:BZIP domain-containing protein n=1 Tax=Lentithecium fluviatile CBS 122367 TaxID=1168545 RepID=A0A6G1IFA5_9PLEO|nr:hypothetical protein K458DRAFT_492189 [Lentithecium fluviatile CBS 122367]
MDSDAAPSGDRRRAAKSTRKRCLTEDRRRQNREAQRRYRERRKPGVEQTLPAVSTDMSPHGLFDGTDLDGLCGLQMSTPFSQMGFLSLCLDDTSTNPCIFDESTLMLDPPREPQSQVRPHQDQTPTLPSPYRNFLQVQMLGFYAARIQNALHLGVPLFLAQKNDATISPWYWHTRYAFQVSPQPQNTTTPINTSNSSSSGASTYTFQEPLPIRRKPCFTLHPPAQISPDLTPTPLQHSHPHGMYLDLIPFPIFRDRAITLLSMTPPAFDEGELRRDIEAEGLLVWGAGGGSSGSATGLVRDRRNWECARWFARKWRLLVEGSGLDEQTRWWRVMRGEDEDEDGRWD